MCSACPLNQQMWTVEALAVWSFTFTARRGRLHLWPRRGKGHTCKACAAAFSCRCRADGPGRVSMGDGRRKTWSLGGYGRCGGVRYGEESSARWQAGVSAAVDSLSDALQLYSKHGALGARSCRGCGMRFAFHPLPVVEAAQKECVCEG